VIVEFLLQLVLGFLGDVLSAVLPDGEPLGLPDVSGLLYGYNLLNTILPLSEVLTAIGIMLGVSLAVFLFRLVLTLWHALPFKFS